MKNHFTDIANRNYREKEAERNRRRKKHNFYNSYDDPHMRQTRYYTRPSLTERERNNNNNWKPVKQESERLIWLGDILYVHLIIRGAVLEHFQNYRLKIHQTFKFGRRRKKTEQKKWIQLTRAKCIYKRAKKKRTKQEKACLKQVAPQKQSTNLDYFKLKI